MTRSNQPSLSAFVRRLLSHSPLTDEEQGAILDLPTQAMQVGKRDVITPGQTVDQAILVADGLLARFDTMRNGARQITAVHIPGDMCDLQSVISPTSGWGTTTLSTSTLLRVAHRDLKRLASEFPNIALAFWRDTVLDASILAKWVANVGRKDARGRLAHFLCELAWRIERAGRGQRDSFGLNMTQEHMGDAVGLTSVHVNRTLQGLHREGLASIKGQHVDVHDWNGLVSAGEFSTQFLLIGDRAERSLEQALVARQPSLPPRY